MRRFDMKRKRFTEEQIIGILRKADKGEKYGSLFKPRRGEGPPRTLEPVL